MYSYVKRTSLLVDERTAATIHMRNPTVVLGPCMRARHTRVIHSMAIAHRSDLGIIDIFSAVRTELYSSEIGRAHV